MPDKRRSTDNLRPIKKGELSKEEAKRRGAAGGKASGIKRKQYKTIAQVLKDYANFDVTEKEQKQLEALGFTGEQKKLTLFAIPLLKKVLAGDTKALELLIQLLGQDKAKEQQIKKLKAETELLKAEVQKLRMMTGEDREVEDLTALGDMLQVDDEGDTDD